MFFRPIIALRSTIPTFGLEASPSPCCRCVSSQHPEVQPSTEKVNTWCAENADVPGACWVDVSVFTRKTSECSDLFMSTVFAPPVMGTCLVNSEHNTVLLFFVQLVAVDKMICSPLHAPKPPTILHSSEDTRRVRSNHFQKLRKHICQESQRGGV